MLYKLKSFVMLYKARLSDLGLKRAWALLCLQSIIIVLLCLSMVLISFVDQNARLIFYLALVASLMVLTVVGLIYNLMGKYSISAWITIICFIIGPWCSFLSDKAIINGDIVPLM